MRGTIMALPWLFETYAMSEIMSKYYDRAILLHYGDQHPCRRKRRASVDVEALVSKWTDNIVRLCLSHDKQGRDEADFEADELLGPILTAPVAQLREFAVKLTAGLKDDKRIPWLMWSMFENWTSGILLKMDDRGTIELKKDLAREVAELAEKSLDGQDWILAMTNALQWRSARELEAVKANLQKGTKPKVSGRESCLFLEVGDAMVML